MYTAAQAKKDSATAATRIDAADQVVADQILRKVKAAADKGWNRLSEEFDANGVIVVCLAANKSDWRDNTCLDANGKNAWTDVANINIPGHVLIGFEYRFTGSGGYRNLVLYFKKR